ncbi:MAG: nuclear transport factor 2 family protein [Pyrinomonadaceae bacterium]
MKKKIILLSLALIFSALANDSIQAQSTEKTDQKKEQPTTTTVDAWRVAAPLSEQPLVVSAAVNEGSEVEESSRQIEKRLTDLEMKLAESLKTSDSDTLRQLLADDFLPVGINLSESKTSKNGFIDWILKNSEHKSLAAENVKVRVFGTDTAIVTVQYKKVSNGVAGATDAVFVATDVWVKRGNFWQVASHHISPLTKP